MESGKVAKTPEGVDVNTSKFSHSRRVSLYRALAFNFLLIIIPVVMYYIAVVQAEKAYSIERGFRALTEVRLQVDQNLDALQSIIPLFAQNALESIFTKDKKRKETITRLQELAKELDKNGKTIPDWLTIRQCLVDPDHDQNKCKDAIKKTKESSPQGIDALIIGVLSVKKSSSNRFEVLKSIKESKNSEAKAILPYFCPYIDEMWEFEEICNDDLTELLESYEVLMKGFLKDLKIKSSYGRIKEVEEEGENQGKEKLHSYLTREPINDNCKVWSEHSTPRDSLPIEISVDSLYTTSFSACLAVVSHRDGRIIEFQAPMENFFASSAAIDEFDQVFVGTSTGKLIFAHSRARETFPVEDHIHKTIRDPAQYAWFEDLLRQGNLIEKFGSKEAVANILNKSGNPEEILAAASIKIGQQMVLEREIGNKQYTVFIKPVHPREFIKPKQGDTREQDSSCGSKMCLLETCNNSCDKDVETKSVSGSEENVFYLIGLKEKKILFGVARDINPLLIIGITFFIAVLFFIWPVVRLIFLEPHDSLTRVQLVHLFMGVLLLTSTLVFFSKALHDMTEMRLFLDNKAEKIAKDIDSKLKDNINSIVSDLHNLKNNVVFTGLSEKEFVAKYINCTHDYRAHDCKTNDVDCIGSVIENYCQMNNILIDRKNGRYKDKLPYNDLIHIFRLDKEGEKKGATIGLYGFPLIPNSMKLDGRKYFQMLKDGYYWRIDEDVVQGKGFIAQRIYNKGDGTKTTQIAIPIENSSSGEFQGILAGHSSLMDFTEAILPLHFRFAIIDKDNGTVLYHSDDRRSLVENFFVETENDPQLLSALSQNKNDVFTGSYHGQTHKFHYRDLDSLPWGLIVFYPLLTSDSMMMENFINGLVSYGAFAIYFLIFPVALAHMFFGRPSWLWPQWRLRNAYPVVTISLVLIGLTYLYALSIAIKLEHHVLLLSVLPFTLLSFCYASMVPIEKQLFLNLMDKRRVAALIFLISLFIPCYVISQHFEYIGYVIAIVWYLAIVGVPVFGFWDYVKECHANGMNNSRKEIRSNPWRLDLKTTESYIQIPQAYYISYALFFLTLLFVLAVVPAMDMASRITRDRLDGALTTGLTITGEKIVKHIETVNKNFRRLRKSERLDHLTKAESRVDFLPLKEEFKELRGFGFSNKNSKDDTDITFELAFGEELTRKDFHKQDKKEADDWPELVWRKWMPVFSEESGMQRFAEPGIGAGKQKKISITSEFVLEDEAARVSLTVPNGESLQREILKIAKENTELNDGSEARTENTELKDSAKVRDKKVNYFMGVIIPDLVSVLIILMLINFLLERLFGIRLAWSGLMGPQGKLPKNSQGKVAFRHHLLIRPGKDVLKIKIPGYKDRDFGEVSETHRIDLARDRVSNLFFPRTEGEWLLENLDIAILDEQRRSEVLELLEELTAAGNTNVYLTADVPPLYRLVHPQAYPTRGTSEDLVENKAGNVGEVELLRWCDVLARFRKEYPYRELANIDQSTQSGIKISDKDRKRLEDYADRELRVFWPELEYLQESLHKYIKDGRIKSKRSIREYISIHGEILFRRRWEYCTRQERLALYQLAKGWVVNPRNSRVLEHLIRRGFVVLEPMPKIINETLARFIVNAEPPGRFELWKNEAADGIWQSLRIPFFIIFMLLVAWLAHTSGEVFQTLMALLASTVGFFATAMRAISFARGSGVQANN